MPLLDRAGGLGIEWLAGPNAERTSVHVGTCLLCMYDGNITTPLLGRTGESGDRM